MAMTSGSLLKMASSDLALSSRTTTETNVAMAPLQKAELHRLLAALDLPCAVVLADKGRAGLRKRVEHVVGENFHIERRARRRDRHRAEGVDGRLDDNVGEREHRALHARGKADAQNALQARTVDTQRFPLHAHAFIRARQADVEQCRAHGVGRHRGDGDAVDRHMQHNDEKRGSAARSAHRRPRAPRVAPLCRRCCGRSRPQSCRAISPACREDKCADIKAHRGNTSSGTLRILKSGEAMS